MDSRYCLDLLYPFQDQVLSIITGIDTEFHLTGGTALSRGYLNHRFSEDLDFFVNDDPQFSLWTDRIIHELTPDSRWKTSIVQREERYVQLNMDKSGTLLKIDMINDVPSRIGEPWIHPTLGRIDTPENILANKVTAVIDRTAPKDLADIWGLCVKMHLSLVDAITGAQGKAAGIFPVDLARVLSSVTYDDWKLVRWIEAPDPMLYQNSLINLGKSLILPE